MKFSAIKDRIKNNPGFKSLKQIKEAGYRIAKERDGDRYFLARQEELKPLLVRLRDIAEVRFGIKTGCNEFFYLPSKHFDIRKDGKYYELIPKYEGLPKGIRIEEEYLPPAVLSPRDIDALNIKSSTIRKHLLLLHPKQELSNGLKRYFQWGEQQNINDRPSCRSREKWWALAGRPSCLLACNYLVNDYMRFYYSRDGVWFSDNFQEVHVSRNPIVLSICLNSIISQFFTWGIILALPGDFRWPSTKGFGGAISREI